MVDCAEFLQSYSEYRDGVLPSTRMDAFDAHRLECDACARYDRVIGGGVEVFRALESLTPSSDFQERLRERIWSVDRAEQANASGSSLAVTMLICAALGVGAWLPALVRSDEPVRLPPVVAHAPYHDLSPALFQSAALQPAPLRTQGYYRSGLLLDPTQLTMLAFRPTQTVYTPR